MLAVKFHEAAALEAAQAIAWFEIEAGLGRPLREEIEAAVERIRKNPLTYSVVYRSNIRRALTRRFPYSLIFSVEDQYVFIIAVFHSSRDPMIWEGRVD